MDGQRRIHKRNDRGLGALVQSRAIPLSLIDLVIFFILQASRATQCNLADFNYSIMKQRLSALDIRALVAALKRKGLIGMKVANIYDISGRQYLVKFQRGSKKEMVLIESGIRMHTTSYQRDKNQIPSAYSMKVTTD